MLVLIVNIIYGIQMLKITDIKVMSVIGMPSKSVRVVNRTSKFLKKIKGDRIIDAFMDAGFDRVDYTDPLVF